MKQNRKTMKGVGELMSKLKKKLSAIIMVSILTTTILTGCGKDSKEIGNVKGRYVETTVEIPKELESSSAIKMEQSEDGLPIIYASEKKNNKVNINIYKMQENGKWTKDSPEWLQDISLQDEEKFTDPSITVNDIFSDKQGRQYIYYNQYDSSIGMAYLCMTTDGKERTYLTFEGWNEAEESNNATYYNMPRDVKVLNNGDIMAQFNSEIIVYDNQTKEEKASFPVESNEMSSATITDKNVFMVQRNYETGYITGVASIDTEDYTKPVQTYTYEGRTESYEPKLSTNENGDIILLDTEGIHVLTAGASLWNTVVIGELNTMYMPSAGIIDMYQNHDENYYVLYRLDGSGYYLAKYQYDKDTVSVPNKNITVYTLKDDMVLREAAVAFNKEHPDVMVTIEVAMDRNSSTTADDYIKALNTQLLASSGPDILVTDGLPVDSYIDKSVLLDLKDIIQPMIDSGELLSTVMDSYDTSGHIFTVPTRISPYILVGRSDTVNMAKTFDGLVEASKQTWKRPLIGEITPQDLISNFLPAELSSIISRENGKKVIDYDKLLEFLTKAQNLYNNIDGVTEYSNGGMYNVFSLPYSIQTTLTNIGGFYNSTFEVAIKNFIKNGSIESYDNAYKGVIEVGINVSTKYPDIAKEFIKSLLSEEMQTRDYSAGVPINNKAIDQFIDLERDVAAYTGIQNEEGESVMFEIPWFSKEDRELLAQICRSVDNRVSIDERVLEVIEEQFSKSIVNGSSMEECADKIGNELNLYLSE